MGFKEGAPKIAVLSSYHGAERVKAFEEAERRFRQTDAGIVHPPSFKLRNPSDSKDVFVLREGDPDKPPHLIQIDELNRMRVLKDDAGNGFGYVVCEDGKVGMHTAAEMAFLFLNGVWNISSREIAGFRDVPFYAQDTLRKTVQTIFPLKSINRENLILLQQHSAKQPKPVFTQRDRSILIKLIKNAILQQRFGEKLHPILVASESPIKQSAFHKAVKEAYPFDHYVLVDSVETNVPHIPAQPFQYQGVEGAHARIRNALIQTEGYDFQLVGSYENFLAAFVPNKFYANTWGNPDQWATQDQIDRYPSDLIYADVACFAFFDPKTRKLKTFFSKPVVVPSEIALEALHRGPNTLYSEVLKERDSRVVLNDPHSTLTSGRYSRLEQLLDVTRSALNNLI